MLLQIDGSFKFKPDALTHSKIVAGAFGAEGFGRIAWKDFLALVLALGFDHLLTQYTDRKAAIDDLAKRTGCKIATVKAAYSL